MLFERNTTPPLITKMVPTTLTNSPTLGALVPHRESTSVVRRDLSGAVAPIPSLPIDDRTTYRLKNGSQTSSFPIVAGGILSMIYKPFETLAVWSTTLCPLDRCAPVMTS